MDATPLSEGTQQELKAISNQENLGQVLKLDAGKIESHLDGKVRQAVEDVLNGMLTAEADALCNARRYERSPDRTDTRAGQYQRKLQTKAGEVTLNVPKLRTLPFETAIIERYRRRESSVEEALIEMYLAGVSVRRVEDITEVLWGTRVKPSTVSDLNQQIYGRIEAWRNAPIAGEHPYVYLDGIWLKRSWGGEVRNVSVLVAIGVDQDGFWEILGVAEGTKEDSESWRSFLRYASAPAGRCNTPASRSLQQPTYPCRADVEKLGDFLPCAALLITCPHDPFPQIVRVVFHAYSIGYCYKLP